MGIPDQKKPGFPLKQSAISTIMRKKCPFTKRKGKGGEELSITLGAHLKGEKGPRGGSRDPRKGETYTKRLRKKNKRKRKKREVQECVSKRGRSLRGKKETQASLSKRGPKGMKTGGEWFQKTEKNVLKGGREVAWR